MVKTTNQVAILVLGAVRKIKGNDVAASSSVWGIPIMTSPGRRMLKVGCVSGGAQ